HDAQLRVVREGFQRPSQGQIAPYIIALQLDDKVVLPEHRTTPLGDATDSGRAVAPQHLREQPVAASRQHDEPCVRGFERGAIEERERRVAVELDVHGSWNAEVGTRNVQAGFWIHHSPVDRSSNNTTRPPPSRITSTYRRTIGNRHHSSSIRHVSPIDST